MYESEANSRREPLERIPKYVRVHFHELRSQISAKTLLPWSEHCTECVAPACYSTCDLYAPRADKKCRRFSEGMVRIDDPRAVNGYILKISFKRWGELFAYGNTHLLTMQGALRQEAADRRTGGAIFKMPMPRLLREQLMKRRYLQKRDAVLAREPSDVRPNCFIVEAFNPQDYPITVSFSIRPADPKVKVQFHRLLTLPPGFTRERIFTEEIARAVDIRSRFYVSLIPNDIADGTTLYFGVVDFVYDRSLAPVASRTKVKCVVWDLDNTLWEGNLIEDGADLLVPRAEAVRAVQELDRRGIVHSIASKNNPEDATEVLQRFGLDRYFLHPQISWGPKSAAVERIARALNIGLDTILFVDDAEFERAEVQAALPSVRVMDTSACATLLTREDCDVKVTAEGALRRERYQQAIVRDAAAEAFGSDYLAFLKDCQIRLSVSELTESNLERVHELTQRTNQMNFSGNIYSRDVLRDLMQSSLKTYVLSCSDRFGSYGTIGFCILDDAKPRVTDLMFSCRTQSKRIEHAFLTYLLNDVRSTGRRDCFFLYRKTPRNAAAGKVFDDFGMEQVAERDGVATLVFRADRAVPDDGIVEVTEQRAFNPLLACVSESA